MEKDKVLNLFKRFEDFLAERKTKKSNIYITLEIKIKPDGNYTHYIFILDEESEKSALAHIKGFEKMPYTNEVKTFGDALEMLEREENE